MIASMTALAATGLFLTSMTFSAAQAPSSEPAPPCALTEADKVANAELDFDAFDQRPTTPATFRALANRGCLAEAAEAMEDYLLRGPDRGEGQQRNNLFHLAQVLALQGAEREAARLVAASRNPVRSAPDGAFDWNGYVEGVWAFLVKDRPRLAGAAGRLAEKPGDGNRMNAGVLNRLLTCFDRSYAEAMNGESCSKGQ